jgi:hypothetical protein
MSDVGLIYGVGRREARVMAVVDDDESFREACWREGGVRSSRGRHPKWIMDFAPQYPARTRTCAYPVNALLTPSRTTAHDSGPAWLATPWSYDSLIHCPAPVISARRTWT